MKQSFYFLGFLFLGLTSCSSKSENQTENINHPISDSVVNSITDNSSFIDEHNAKNSLDWMGVYQGILPCNDCEGIKTEITLNTDGTFLIKEEYLNSSKTINEFKGLIDWDDNGMEIELDNENTNFDKEFKVVEGALLLLDANGDLYQGELSEKYRLIKQ